MQITGGAVSNLTQIATRNHPDLQRLNYSDDHLAYPPGGWYHNCAGITFGADASKPGTIAVDNIYIATDSLKMYYSYTANAWTEITGAFADKAATQGSILYRAAQGWKSLAPGNSGDVLTSGGASANPSFAAPTFVPTGAILPYGGVTAPSGYVLCDGSSLLRAGTYAALFAVLGTLYGTADGTHFNVPDMRGRVSVGLKTGTFGTQGGTGGEETHALTAAENGPHTHGIANNFFADVAQQTNLGFKSGNSVSNTGITTDSSGSGTGHNNLQPYLVNQHIIKI